MQALSFTLAISADDYLRYYRGSASQVVVKTDQGKTLRFPANLLQQYVTREGIHGRFQLEFDQNNKVKRLQKIQG